MKKYWRFTIYIVLLFIFISMIIVGCRGAEKPDAGMEEKKDMRERGNIDDDMNIDDDNDRKVAQREDRKLVERAENIADYIVDLPNVDDATAVVTKSNDVIVGVDIGDETDGKLTDKMKSQIENSVRETDKQIRNIYVTDDSNLFERIDDIEYGLMKGKDITTYNRDIDNIINRIKTKR